MDLLHPILIAALTGFLSGLVLSIPVGPVNLTIINEGARRGFRWAMLISLLAASDASTRGLMSAGFVCFGIAVPVFAFQLRQTLTGPTWMAVLVSGLATLGVAAFPLSPQIHC